MKLRQRYALVFGAISVLIVLVVSIFHLYIHEPIDKRYQDSSFKAMSDALYLENEQAASALVKTLTSSLVEPIVLHDFEDIGNIAKSALKLSRVSKLLVFDDQGIVIHDGTDTINNFGNPVSPDILEKLHSDISIKLHRDDKALQITSPINISDRIVGGLYVEFKLDEIVIHIDNLSSELASISESSSEQQITTTILLVIFLSMLAMLGGYIISRQLSDPVMKLTQQAKRIGSGQYNFDTTITKRHDEIGELTDSLRWMAQKLSKHTVTKGELEKLVQTRTDELEKVNEKLLQIDKTRRELLTDLGHELRTPLTAIRGIAEVNLRTNQTLNNANKTALIRIVELCGQLGSLVDDLLFISRSESGMPELNIESVSICTVLSNVCKSIESIAEKEKINIIFTCEKDSWIDGDSRRLMQLFTIFVDNAVKYSHFGSDIHVNINLQESESGNFAEVRISDKGIGMTAEEQEQSFSRFFRGSRAQEKHRDGMGLGLAIANAIIHAHGGHFQIESEVDEGATMIVSFPVNS